jgi:hypothetical protein
MFQFQISGLPSRRSLFGLFENPDSGYFDEKATSPFGYWDYHS